MSRNVRLRLPVAAYLQLILHLEKTVLLWGIFWHTTVHGACYVWTGGWYSARLCLTSCLLLSSSWTLQHDFSFSPPKVSLRVGVHVCPQLQLPCCHPHRSLLIRTVRNPVTIVQNLWSHPLDRFLIKHFLTILLVRDISLFVWFSIDFSELVHWSAVIAYFTTCNAFDLVACGPYQSAVFAVNRWMLNGLFWHVIRSWQVRGANVSSILDCVYACRDSFFVMNLDLVC